MVAYQMDRDQEGGALGFLERLSRAPALRQELGELAHYLEDRSDRPQRPLPGFPHVPLCLHAPYERREILAALGRWTDNDRPLSNTGIERCIEDRWEAFFITIDKSNGFTGRVAYHDAAIAPDRLQWQTQSGTTPTSAVGRRYLESSTNGWRFLLFVQERKGTPFHALGPIRSLIAHHGSKPMTLVWQLEAPMSQELFQRFSPVR